MSKQQAFVEYFTHEFMEELWYLQKVARGDIPLRKEADPWETFFNVTQALLSVVPIPGLPLGFLLSKELVKKCIKYGGESLKVAQVIQPGVQRVYEKSQEFLKGLDNAQAKYDEIEGKEFTPLWQVQKQGPMDLVAVRILVELIGRGLAERYEHVLVEYLADSPAESQVPLARVAARRIFEYLQSKPLLKEPLGENHLLAQRSRLLNGVMLVKEREEKSWWERLVESAGKPLPRWLKEMHKVVLPLQSPFKEQQGFTEKFTAEGVLTCSAWYDAKVVYSQAKTEWQTPKKGPSQQQPKYGYAYLTSLKPLPTKDLKQDSRLCVAPPRDRRYYRPVGLQDIQAYLESPEVKVARQTKKTASLSFHDFLSQQNPKVLWQAVCHDDLTAIKDWSFGHFQGVDFSGAQITGVVSGASFAGAYLVGVTATPLQCAEEYPVDFSRAALGFADLREAKLPKAQFTQADLSLTNLSGADLTAIQCDGTNWYKTDLSDVKREDLWKKQAEQVKAAQAAFENQMRQFDERLNALDSKLEKTQKDLEGLEKQMTQKVKDLEKQQSQQSAGSDQQKSKTEAEIQELRDKITQLQSQLAKSANTEFIECCSAALKDLQRRADELDQRVDVLEDWAQQVTDLLTEQQSEVKEAKGEVTTLKTQLESLQKKFLTQRQQQVQRDHDMVALQQRLAAAPDAQAVKALQAEIKDLKDAFNRMAPPSESPPDNLLSALQGYQSELTRQQGLKEKLVKTPALRSKYEPQLKQLKAKQQRLNDLFGRLTKDWAAHVEVQNKTLAVLQSQINTVAEQCHQRLQALEADVAKLKSWAEETGQRLAAFESEESDTQNKLKALQEGLIDWVKQQQSLQAEVVQLRQALKGAAPGDEKGSQRLIQRLQELEKNSQQTEQSTVKEQIVAAQTSYQEQKATIEAVQAEEGDADGVLAAALADINRKMEALSAIEKDFIGRNQARLDQLQSDTQQLQHDLQKLTQRVDQIDEKVAIHGQEIQHAQKRIDEHDPHITLRKRLLELRKKVLEDKEITQELACYTPPNGKSRRESDDKSATDLFEWVKTRFLSPPHIQVLLLEAPGGAGKTTFNRYLMRQLWSDPAWESWKPGDKAPTALIPIFVPLGSEQVEPAHLFDYLRNLPQLESDFTDAEIHLLKKEYHLLWIADGYDEMPRTSNKPSINLYDKNGFKKYQGRVKLLISRRDEPPVAADEEKRYFKPADDHPAASAYVYYYVARFSHAQRDGYIQRYIDHLPYSDQKPEVTWREVDRYRQHFAKIPDVDNLISTPFLLRVAVEVLPGIVAQVEKEAKRSSKSGQLSKLEMTRKRLLDGFTTGWFERQVRKSRRPEDFLTDPGALLGDDVVEALQQQHPEEWKEVCLKKGYWIFCQQFATNLQKDKLTSAIYPPLPVGNRQARFSSPPSSDSSLPSAASPPPLSRQGTRSSISPWMKDLLDSEDKDMDLCRRGSPLRTTRHGEGRGSQVFIEYGFLHALLINFFEASISDQEQKQATAAASPAAPAAPSHPLGALGAPLPSRVPVSMSANIGPTLIGGLAASSGRGKPALPPSSRPSPGFSRKAE